MVSHTLYSLAKLPLLDTINPIIPSIASKPRRFGILAERLTFPNRFTAHSFHSSGGGLDRCLLLFRRLKTEPSPLHRTSGFLHPFLSRMDLVESCSLCLPPKHQSLVALSPLRLPRLHSPLLWSLLLYCTMPMRYTRSSASPPSPSPSHMEIFRSGELPIECGRGT